ncbi:MAG: DEAD/DEAH box helicase [Thermodesulfovibrionales bacterium]|nr:DEAD/DEAH box helicase [Thermodesulfovibrionales bacterium]
MMRFEDFNLDTEILKAIADMGFEEPTAIQELVIPKIMQGKDIIGQALTGTGKTAAFGIPILQRCKNEEKPFALILEPTRELAMQVSQELNKLGKYKRCQALPIYGGKSIEMQIRALQKGVDIVVGTPGRVIDHLERGTLSLDTVKFLVLDEADEMLNMGFIEDVERIINQTPTHRQTMLFSATMPQPIVDISKKHLKNPERIRANTKDVVVPKISQVFYEVKDKDKINALIRLLDVEDPELAIVFCHTKKEVDDVALHLQETGFNAAALHGDFTQAHRDEVMSKFKAGKLDILVATDVAARGLDIQNVSHVINFSIPHNPDSYIHRIGRTARAGKSGIAITFVRPQEYKTLRLIEKTAKTRIDKKSLPSERDVFEAKSRSIIRDVEEIITSEGHKLYLPLVKEMAERNSLFDIAAAALFSAYGDIKTVSTDKEADYVRLFMTIGKKDKIHVGDIVRNVAKEANIPPNKIGKIDVMDKFTFIEVPQDLADKVIRSVDEMIMSGRKVRIEKAKEKPEEAISQVKKGNKKGKRQ